MQELVVTDKSVPRRTGTRGAHQVILYLLQTLHSRQLRTSLVRSLENMVMLLGFACLLMWTMETRKALDMYNTLQLRKLPKLLKNWLVSQSVAVLFVSTSPPHAQTLVIRPAEGVEALIAADVAEVVAGADSTAVDVVDVVGIVEAVVGVGEARQTVVASVTLKERR